MREQLRTSSLASQVYGSHPFAWEQFSLLRVELVNHEGEDDGQPE